jgi:riboflavin biosynthesis pyrimidine reductase
VDKLMVFISPRIMGKGIEAVADLAIDSVADSLPLGGVTVSSVGGDILVTGYPREGR